MSRYARYRRQKPQPQATPIAVPPGDLTCSACGAKRQPGEGGWAMFRPVDGGAPFARCEDCHQHCEHCGADVAEYEGHLDDVPMCFDCAEEFAGEKPGPDPLADYHAELEADRRRDERGMD